MKADGGPSFLAGGAAVILVLCSWPAAAAAAPPRVVGPSGEPVEGARVMVVLPATVPSSSIFGRGRVEGVTGASGELGFGLPRLPGVRILVDAAGYAPLAGVAAEAVGEGPISLERGVTLSGRLSGDGELPPGPGTVCAVWRPFPSDDSLRLRVRRCASVAADGRFTLEALAPGGGTVEAEVPGYLPLSAPWEPGATASEEWVGDLDPGSRARVRVEDAGGSVVGGAVVRCEDAVETVVDARGTAQVALAKPSTPCWATKVGLGESVRARVRAPMTVAQLLRIVTLGELSGRVLGDDGTLPGELRFELAREHAHRRRSLAVDAEIDEEGSFRVIVAEAGSYALRIQGEGWLPATTPTFDVSLGTPVDAGVVVLRRGAGVRGELYHAVSGDPLPGAAVTVVPAGRGRLTLINTGGRATTLSDAEGGFTAAGLPTGRFSLRIDWEGVAPLVTEVELPEERVVELGPLYLHLPVRVSGRVERADGSPLVGAQLAFVASLLRDAEPLVSSQTGAGGAIAPVEIAPGRYRVLVRSGRLLLDQEVAIPVAPRFEIELRLASTRLVGLVSEGGLPVGGGDVVLRPLLDPASSLGVVAVRQGDGEGQRWVGRADPGVSGPVGPDGTFVLDDAPRGRLEARYFGPGGRQAARIVDVADEAEASLTIELAGSDLHGTVVDGHTRAGLEARLRLVNDDGNTVAEASSGASGDFLVPAVAPGAYRLTVRARGYRRPEALPLHLGVREPSPLVVELEPGKEASLKVRLRRSAGGVPVPVPGAAVVVVDALGESLRSLPTDWRGVLGLSGLDPGPVHLVWSDPLSGTGSAGPFDLRPGEQEVIVDVQPGRDLQLRCRGDGCPGSPVRWLAVLSEGGIDLAPYLVRSSAITFSETSGASIGRLAPGSYALAVISGRARVEKVLEVASGPGEVTVDLRRR